MSLQIESQVRIKANFRIMGVDLEPDEVTKALGLSPDYSHRKGDPRIGSGGRRYSDYTEGIWMLRSKIDSKDIASHISELANAIIKSKDAFLKLVDGGLRADFFIGVVGIVGQYGYILPPDLLRLVVDLRLTIGFDIYCNSADHSEIIIR